MLSRISPAEAIFGVAPKQLSQFAVTSYENAAPVGCSTAYRHHHRIAGDHAAMGITCIGANSIEPVAPVRRR